MDFALGLNQTLRQEQTLSPQMLQALSLLPMPIQELEAHIQQAIESNPAFEIPESSDDIPLSAAEDRSTRDRNLDEGMDDADSSDYESMSYDSGSYDNAGSDYEGFDPEASDRKQMMIENSGAWGQTLKEHLLKQLGETRLSEEQYAIGEMLISNLDSNGFSIMSPNELFSEKNYSKDAIQATVSIVQGFDPAGICVPDFRSSLILQARLSGMAPSDLSIFSDMVNNHLEKLKAGKFREVSSALRISEEDLHTFYDILRSLTPYPGQSFSSEPVSSVVPEFSIHCKEGVLVLDMNRSSLPALEISPDFENLAKGLRGPEAKEASAYISSSISQAKILINQVNMRFQTMYKAALAIMEVQRDFFMQGPMHLKTMTLRDIAEKIGVHETTMSRLAQSKWVDTDWGMFQLKYFFSQGVASTSGSQESISRNVVKDMIAQIISENGSRLSDQKISDILLSRGIKCARRTVGKYRSELNIDSSYTR